jgi:hypothetical protein
VDTFEENQRLGRFVVAEDAFVAGGGIVREVWSDTVGAQARVIRLDVRLMTEPDGNLVDLSREAGPIEFDLSPGFRKRWRYGSERRTSWKPWPGLPSGTAWASSSGARGKGGR